MGKDHKAGERQNRQLRRDMGSIGMCILKIFRGDICGEIIFVFHGISLQVKTISAHRSAMLRDGNRETGASGHMEMEEPVFMPRFNSAFIKTGWYAKTFQEIAKIYFEPVD